MKFLFSCSIWYLTHSLRLFVRYRVEHLKRNSISQRTHVLFSIQFITFFFNNNVIVHIVSSPFELLEYSPLWTHQLPKIFEVSNPTKPVKNHPMYSRYINRMHDVHTEIVTVFFHSIKTTLNEWVIYSFTCCIQLDTGGYVNWGKCYEFIHYAWQKGIVLYNYKPKSFWLITFIVYSIYKITRGTSTSLKLRVSSSISSSSSSSSWSRKSP